MFIMFPTLEMKKLTQVTDCGFRDPHDWRIFFFLSPSSFIKWKKENLIKSWFQFTYTCSDFDNNVLVQFVNENNSLKKWLSENLWMCFRELYRNDISGKIPKELGKLKSLVSMDLYDNRFEGKIPKSFSKLKSLRFL